ncbi:hypothetical protein DPMN_155455 [Dreissena polymorpha]|uniref:Uncharacterized protein n=1 Tax=Dreissena polymorpha TaxID=45954 RepID=A0A9D4FR82_DREPO|nr:hypothetical protein DPMN_155455 [Dreissena polymorpha]
MPLHSNISSASRPGRVRKKPAKFEDDDSTSDDGQSVPTMTSLTLPTPTMGSSSMAQISDSSPDTSMDLRDESDGQQVTPARASRVCNLTRRLVLIAIVYESIEYCLIK